MTAYDTRGVLGNSTDLQYVENWQFH